MSEELPDTSGTTADTSVDTGATDAGLTNVAPPDPVPVYTPPPIYQAPQVTPQTAPSLSLDDFMQSLSRSDDRVSLVNAFAAHARSNDFNRATADDFSTAYVAFCNAPA